MSSRSPGVRARTTFVATGVVAVALVMALVIIGFVTRSRLISAITDAAAARAEALVQLVEAGTGLDTLPGRDPELVAQVIGTDGTVLAADPAAAGLAPFTSARPAPGETVVLRTTAPPGLIDDEGIPETGKWVEVVRGSAGGEVVVVAAQLDDATEVFGAAIGIVALGAVGIIAAVALATWILTGRALRPVDRMRSEAAQISAGALDRRLEVPGTGDEISRLATTLNEMLARLDEAATSRRRFVADASHELRSPVSAMRAMLDVTGSEPPDTELRGALEAEVSRMERLVADLLALARSDAAPTSRAVEVDIDQVLRDEAAAMRHRSPMTVETSEVHAARALADPDAVTRIVRNLADNAIAHARAKVWLTSRVESGQVIFGVDDDGPGIAAQDRERVFERLVRLDGARDRASGGTGLGLSVVRALARAAGGDARFVESRRGGASAEVTLPAVESGQAMGRRLHQVLDCCKPKPDPLGEPFGCPYLTPTSPARHGAGLVADTPRPVPAP